MKQLSPSEYEILLTSILTKPDYKPTDDSSDIANANGYISVLKKNPIIHKALLNSEEDNDSLIMSEAFYVGFLCDAQGNPIELADTADNYYAIVFKTQYWHYTGNNNFLIPLFVTDLFENIKDQNQIYFMQIALCCHGQLYLLYFDETATEPALIPVENSCGDASAFICNQEGISLTSQLYYDLPRIKNDCNPYSRFKIDFKTPFFSTAGYSGPITDFNRIKFFNTVKYDQISQINKGETSITVNTVDDTDGNSAIEFLGDSNNLILDSTIPYYLNYITGDGTRTVPITVVVNCNGSNDVVNDLYNPKYYALLHLEHESDNNTTDIYDINTPDIYYSSKPDIYDINTPVIDASFNYISPGIDASFNYISAGIDASFNYISPDQFISSRPVIPEQSPDNQEDQDANPSPSLFSGVGHGSRPVLVGTTPSPEQEGRPPRPLLTGRSASSMGSGNNGSNNFLQGTNNQSTNKNGKKNKKKRRCRGNGRNSCPQLDNF